MTGGVFDMKQHLNLVFEKHNYPAEAREFLLQATDILMKNEKFAYVVENFYKKQLRNYEDIVPRFGEIAAETNLSEHTVSFLIYLCCTKEMREKYAEKGLSEEIYWDSVNDFLYKLHEGKSVVGVWGFHQSPWFYHFLAMHQFKLGRLEFTMGGNYWDFEFEICGKKVTRGMPVLHVHIPSAKEPFTKEACYDSYDKAYHFFKDVMHYDYVCFCCGSWLLFPKHKELLKEGSNIARFIDDFKLVHRVVPEDQRHDLWRVFGKDANLPYEQLPKNNSLQKAYAEYLVGGNLLEEGFGAFIWDPVNKKPIID